ncbi:MAG TPA: ATP-binding protein [Candidatus Eisenbacteria bacterium]|nr:ATP-binding protein [Candidatus Eisenbacteria bacterium]
MITKPPVEPPHSGLAETAARSWFDAILSLSRDGILAISTDWIIVGWNKGAERMYGYSAEAIVGRPLSTLVPTDRLHELSAIYPAIARGSAIEEFEAVLVRSDGVSIDVVLSTAPTRDEHGHVTGALALMREVTAIRRAETAAEQNSAKLTEREMLLRKALLALRQSHEETKSAQLQLVQAAKLESIGRLAAGVAHEVKNPLAVIMFAIDYLADTIASPDEDTTAALTDARDAVKRADSVIRGLLDFSTATELSPVTEDVNRVLAKALELVRHALTKAHVLVVEEFEDGLPPAMLDRNKIEQVFVNLMINAIDAMPDGGTLIVRTRRERLTEVGNEVGVRKTDQFRMGLGVIAVEIEDTGTGIDPNCRVRLFDPFFTTKPPGKGTGLGLAVCKSIVALHGGTIRIANKEGGGGARATVVLRSIRSKEVKADG